MINIMAREGTQQVMLDEFQDGCWVNLTAATTAEIDQVADFFQVRRDFVTAALDEEEFAHIDKEDDGSLLIVVDTPIVQKETEDAFAYVTFPLGIILCPKGIITVCLVENSVIEPFLENHVRSFSTNKQTRFLLQILYRNASKFLQYLRQIDKASTVIENELHKSMRNRELIEMMRLEKSLVYFSTSLKGNETVLEKMTRSHAITYYDEDQDLLDDVIIENKQAIEMSTIYRDIMSGTMDTFASIISNNLNIVMKLLAVITIVLSLPQIIFSLFGINAGIPWQGESEGFWYILLIGILSCVAGIIWMWRKKMF